MNTIKEKLILPTLRGCVGDWVYYSSLMNASQISSWIETAKNIREAQSLEEVLQRDLQKRIKNIAKYIKSDESRFFNSIIVGVFDGIPNWVEFEFPTEAKKIIGDNKLNENIKKSMGLLIFEGNEKMFAIDGQHRVEGIKEALKNSNNNLDDEYSIIFIAHTDDKLGMKRSRKLFSDINKNVLPVR